MKDEEKFEKAVWDLLEGHLNEEKFRDLESELLQSEEERNRFLEIVDLHGLLHQKLGVSGTTLGSVPLTPNFWCRSP